MFFSTGHRNLLAGWIPGQLWLPQEVPAAGGTGPVVVGFAPRRGEREEDMSDQRAKSRAAGAAHAAQQDPELAKALGGEAKKMAETMPPDEVKKLARPESDKSKKNRD
jgi:hypothetical protein